MPEILLGTWQFGGRYGQMPLDVISDIIAVACDNGIRKVDTANVYGSGEVESVLGRLLPKDFSILTKVPAIEKPLLNESKSITSFFPPGRITTHLQESLTRLQRDTVETVLLHNWARDWQLTEEITKELNYLKSAGLVSKVGISIPNGFQRRLSKDIVSKIDTIEIPFNQVERQILKDLTWYKENGVKVILRSIFLHGISLKNISQRSALISTDFRLSIIRKRPNITFKDINRIIKEVNSLEVDFILGVTKPSQLIELISYIK